MFADIFRFRHKPYIIMHGAEDIVRATTAQPAPRGLPKLQPCDAASKKNARNGHELLIKCQNINKANFPAILRPKFHSGASLFQPRSKLLKC